jgi:hypothetical protein
MCLNKFWNTSMSFKTFKQSPKSGQAIIELVGALLILVIMFCCISTLSLYFYVNHTVVTAARMGARTAAVNAQLATNFTAGAQTVRDQVKAFFLSSTGQTLSDGDITVNAPTGNVGKRITSVTVNFTLNNPINIGGLLTAMGAANGNKLNSFPVSANSSMRYEE